MPRKFHRLANRRRLFMQGLLASTILRGRIQTTVARAKEIRPALERLVTAAKRQRVTDLRRLMAALPKEAAQKLFYEVAPRYRERAGGYLRIKKDARPRKRDGAARATIEFIER